MVLNWASFTSPEHSSSTALPPALQMSERYNIFMYVKKLVLDFVKIYYYYACLEMLVRKYSFNFYFRNQNISYWYSKNRLDEKKTCLNRWKIK